MRGSISPGGRPQASNYTPEGGRRVDRGEGRRVERSEERRGEGREEKNGEQRTVKVRSNPKI